LSSLQSTSILVPGFDDRVFVKNLSPEVQALPTKTKPKKIQINSLCGQSFSFLLKGHEDLHLDERIQQFIKVANHFLSKDNRSDRKGLIGRTYNVIPFGKKFGMIQWISNVTGIFPLFRKRQYWEHTSKSLQKKDSQISQPLRPFDQFHIQVQSMIASGRISKHSSRSKWPLDALLDIFNNLSSCTPDSIIYDELWCASTSSHTFFRKISNFAKSLGVMSIVGYILGLGDRHLDNILLDISTGQILHIDFNVCFEKGSRLRIPETVPFRLTRNLVRACGPTGYHGNFRLACQETLQVMRDNREILINVLETFVYDPLLDWTKDGSGSEKQLVDLNVQIGLLVSRVVESRPSIQDIMLQLPLQLNTIYQELGHLIGNLILEAELTQETMNLESVTEEDLSDSVTSLKEKYSEAKVQFLRSIDDLSSISVRNSAYLSSLDQRLSSDSILEPDAISILDFSQPWKIPPFLAGNEDESIVSLLSELHASFQILKASLLPCLNFYRSLVNSSYPFFYDVSSRQLTTMKSVMESSYSSSSCNTAISVIRSLRDKSRPQRMKLDSVYSLCIDDMKKSIATLAAFPSLTDRISEATVTYSAPLLESLSFYIWSELLIRIGDLGKGINSIDPICSFCGLATVRDFAENACGIDDHYMPQLIELNLIVCTSLISTERLHSLAGMPNTTDTLKEIYFDKLRFYHDVNFLIFRRLFPAACKLLAYGESLNEIINLGTVECNNIF
jgi:hypothetical protein